MKKVLISYFLVALFSCDFERGEYLETSRSTRDSEAKDSNIVCNNPPIKVEKATPTSEDTLFPMHLDLNTPIRKYLASGKRFETILRDPRNEIDFPGKGEIRVEQLLFD